MLITSGAGGLALQVSVRQRTIDFGCGRASLRLLASQNASVCGEWQLVHDIAQQRNGIQSFSEREKYFRGCVTAFLVIIFISTM